MFYMVNAVYYSKTDNFNDYIDIEKVLRFNKAEFYVANSVAELFNVINADTKLVVIEQREKDVWLEFSIRKRIGKNCNFVYYNSYFKTFKSFASGVYKKIYLYALPKCLNSKKQNVLGQNSDSYLYKIRNLLDCLGLVSYKFNAIIISKILYKMFTRNLPSPTELDFNLICQDLGYDPQAVCKRAGDYLKEWFCKNKLQVLGKYPIFRSFQKINIKKFLPVFMYCLLEDSLSKDKLNIKSFNLEYQINMFDPNFK